MQGLAVECLHSVQYRISTSKPILGCYGPSQGENLSRQLSITTRPALRELQAPRQPKKRTRTEYLAEASKGHLYYNILGMCYVWCAGLVPSVGRTDRHVRSVTD